MLIAIPLLTVVACFFTLWLAIRNPDYLVVDDPQYLEVKAERRAQVPLRTGSAVQTPDDPDGER